MKYETLPSQYDNFKCAQTVLAYADFKLSFQLVSAAFFGSAPYIRLYVGTKFGHVTDFGL